MPKRSKKSKSKRLTLKQKYKVIKKVREHHRKKRRELRKSGREGAVPKGQKDPGIPAAWPFKEELLKEMAWKRQQILAQEKEKREQRKRAREERAAAAEGGDMDADADADNEQQQQLLALTAGAAAKGLDYDARKKAKLLSSSGKGAAAGAGGDADSSRRAFYKEFRRVVAAADVVIQVLDARDPAGCRCPDVERYVRSLDPNKRIILLLNKMDLVPREAGEAWLKYYRRELPTVAFKASTQQQASGLAAPRGGGGKRGGKAAAAAGGAAGAGAGGAAGGPGGGAATCLGADTLLQLLKNYARHRGASGSGKGSITVGVVGLPNVGKSSLINSLKRARVAQVGSTPGVTKGVQEIHLDKHIRLLDSPGIVFSGGDGAAAAALRNAVKVERLADPLTPVGEILRRVPAKQLVRAYKIAAFDGLDGFLQQVAQARGKLKKGGIVDVEAAARIVLTDWNDGRIPFFTLPPKEDAAHQALETAEVVGSWAADFDADKVFADEGNAVIAHLPTLEDAAAAGFFEATPGGAVAMAMEEDDEAAGAGTGAAGAAGAAANGDAMDGSDDDDGGDSDDEYGAGPSGRKAAAATDKAARAAARAAHGENADLYGAEGQHNPKRARAERRASRAKAAAAKGGDDDDDAFDFDEANAAEGLQANGDGMSGSELEGEEEGQSGSGDGSDDEYGADAAERDADVDYANEMET